MLSLWRSASDYEPSYTPLGVQVHVPIASEIFQWKTGKVIQGRFNLKQDTF